MENPATVSDLKGKIYVRLPLLVEERYRALCQGSMRDPVGLLREVLTRLAECEAVDEFDRRVAAIGKLAAGQMASAEAIAAAEADDAETAAAAEARRASPRGSRSATRKGA